MKTTINDIARVANVAKSTVSKVINDAPSISDATKEKVRAIMKELQYTPSSIATQLARQSSMNIGFIMDFERKDDFLNPFFYSLLGGAESVTFEHQYELTISNLHNRNEDFLNRYVYSKKLDGMLVNPSALNRDIVQELERLKFPYVIVGQPKEDYGVTWVDIDNIAGGKLATEHLLEQGYCKIAFLGSNPIDVISGNRMLGYHNVITSLNKSSSEDNNQYVRLSIGNEENGFIMMNELLDLPIPPDAVICVNNFVAFGALRAALSRGLQVPQQLGILTFDNYPLAPYTTPALTALDIDTFNLGVLASQVLFKKIESKTLDKLSYTLKPELIIRESTRRK
ncbi:MAG: LacI family DNA-binding transcriptional regulator [Candidatus Cohnella colombiensis]|uniref:LacI family DNA-binding transcriptional regulator n=1 Tax=Candidatus Cohnella colombiensis TaxID=3121368 RepID=A0AA95EYD4_9BACL|nr:MAG: LacI family DNA-binding transcriptional regulator [Cohnella sp.]